MEVCPAVDDESNASLTLFVFMQGDETAGCAYVREAIIKESFPSLSPVSDALIPEARQDSLNREQRERLTHDGYSDDRWFEAQDRENGIEWHEGLMVDILKREAAVTLALSYAIARNGSAIFEFRTLDDEYNFYEDFDLQQINDGEFFHLSVAYHHEKNGLGFGSNYVVW